MSIVDRALIALLRWRGYRVPSALPLEVQRELNEAQGALREAQGRLAYVDALYEAILGVAPPQRNEGSDAPTPQ